MKNEVIMKLLIGNVFQIDYSICKISNSFLRSQYLITDFTSYFIHPLIKSHLKGIMFPNTIYISLYCTFFIHRCIRIYLKSRSRMSLYIRGKSIFYAMRIIIEIVVHICNCVGKSFVMSF